jgi:hypothetical protein
MFFLEFFAIMDPKFWFWNRWANLKQATMLYIFLVDTGNMIQVSVL